MPLPPDQDPDETSQSNRRMQGPLQGIKVIDLSALGPGPFTSMMLADFGADVLSVRRPGVATPFDPSQGMKRGKRSLAVDLKTPEGIALILRIAERADVFLESSRPGVMERLGLGPEVLLEQNPGLIYTRLTGWGQAGPNTFKAGHDINYLAVSGALGVSGQDRPSVPPALFGDIGNGSYLAAFGIVTALFDRVRTGKGQMIDAAICDGAAFGMAGIFGEYHSRMFNGHLGGHVLSGNAPFYRCYQCADGKWYSVGAIETKFYGAFLDTMGLHDLDHSEQAQWKSAGWDVLRERLDALFLTAPRDEWTRRFTGVDACTTPVLEIEELASDPHLAARCTVVRQSDGLLQSAPAPRLSAYPGLYECVADTERQDVGDWIPADVDLQR